MAADRLRVNVTAPDGDGTSKKGALRTSASASPGNAMRGLGPWLVKIAPAAARGELCVAVVSDRRMRALNRQFRGKDYATDVLSFPAEPSAPSVPPVAFLGDIVIASGVANKQAKEAGHSLKTEIRVLALHGLLHLLGYDHDSDDGKMARAEARLRRKAGLPEGLIERRR